MMADPDAYPIPPRADPARHELLDALLDGVERGMAVVSERTVATDGVELHVVEEGAGLPVVSRPRLPRARLLVAPPDPGAGRRRLPRLAPDQRGYGRSSRPEAIEDYDIVHLTDDLLGLLDDLGEDRPCSSATTGAPWSCGRWRCCSARAGRRRGRA